MNDTRDDERTTHMYVWTAGHNMPGYLPEGDPAVFLTRLDALEYTIGELERAGDQASETDDHAGDCPACEYDDAAERLRSRDADVDGDWYDTFEDGRIAYWFTCVDLPDDEVPESLGGTLAGY